MFDVKFELRHKVRLVGGGSTTMNASRLAMQVAKMNKAKMCAADVGNAFL